MAKKRKKPSKQSTCSKGRQKKEFFRRVESLARAAGAWEAYQLIPNKGKEKLFAIRDSAYEFVSGAETQLTSKDRKFLKNSLNDMLKTSSFQILPDGECYSYFDYFNGGESLITYLRNLKDDDFPAAKEVRLSFTPLLELRNGDNDPLGFLLEKLRDMGYCLSGLDQRLIWINLEFSRKTIYPPRIYSRLEVNQAKVPEITVRIDGINRPVYRVGWAVSEIGEKWISLNLEDLGINGPMNALPFEVYIQSHALHRLSERLDGVYNCWLHYFLYESLVHPVSVQEEGHTLLEYRIGVFKVGYLLVEVIKGVVVIRTFLFLTNAGTPEGNRLTAKFRLDSEDKKFWAIDKLSTFMRPDFRDNDKIKAFFKAVGCESLWDLSEFMQDNHQMQQVLSFSQFLEKNEDLEMFQDCVVAEE